jgi:hypothetical protein
VGLVYPCVPFRKFDEEVLRTLRDLRPHPLPLALDPERTRGALRRDWTTRPPAQPSVAERPSAPCTALRAARCRCRYGRLREGQGWGWRTTTAVRHAPVARP